MSIQITIIAAIGKQRQIGLNSQMPWHLKDDLKNFKKLTLGHPVIMGRKTFESIGKALPKRLNFVLTSRPEKIATHNICLVNNLESAIEKAALEHKEIFIIGGGNLYKQGLELAQKLIITHVDYKGPADTYFPEIDWNLWQKISQKNIIKDSLNDFDFEIATYLKKQL